jgi:hypothetical protein
VFPDRRHQDRVLFGKDGYVPSGGTIMQLEPRRQFIVAIVAVFGLGALILFAPWHSGSVKAAPQAEQANAVRTVPAGTHFAMEPGSKGDTYYWLESQTTRLTTRFADAIVIAERGAGGEVRARVQDENGNEAARIMVTSRALQYVSGAGTPLLALNDSGERPTLNWANRQAYGLWKDGPTDLSWQGGLMRRKGAGRDIEGEVLELETEWAYGLVAKTTRQTVPRYEAQEGSKRRTLGGNALVNRLTKDGVKVGGSVWFAQDQIFLWDLPGLQRGSIGPDQLRQFGGWPFTPDTDWLNLQTIAFYHFKTLINANGFVARNVGSCGRRSGPMDRFASFLVPTVFANTEGCDGLHWLDGTMYRNCCDWHDLCYAKYGCTDRTWWMLWTSWRCDYCNAAVIDCFAEGGMKCGIC